MSPPMTPNRKSVASEVITTRTERLWLDTNGVVWAEVTPGSYETLADAREAIAAQVRLAGNNKVPVLYDMRRLKGIDRDAVDFYYHDATPSRVTLAMALLQSPFIVSFIANTIGIALVKPNYPTRSFTSEDAAYAWLSKIMSRRE